MIETIVRTDTKQRILDTAEKLFSQNGVATTSLRQIIAEADVNLAAIHYHFRSKDALLDAVLVRRLEPVNRERLSRLNACEQAPGPPGLECVLRAFIAPAVQVGADPSRGGLVFVKLMGRILTEEGSFKHVMHTHFTEIRNRFWSAFRRALPQLPPAELAWRIHFTLGAMAHTLRSGPELEFLAPGVHNNSDPEAITNRLVAFASAGLRSPVPE